MKLLVFLLTSLILLFVTAGKSYGYSTAEAKADLQAAATRRIQKEAALSARRAFTKRVQNAERVLAGTPLEGSGKALVKCALDNGLPAGLLLGIARAESSFGRHYTLPHNVWNYGIYLGLGFDSFESGACHVAQRIAQNYDTSSVYSIARKYAPASDGNSPAHWASVVGEVIYQVENL